MIETDSLGRSTFQHIAPQRVTRLTNREVRWFKHIERHGAQSSTYMHELTKSTHRCKDTALRQMQKLRAGGFLHLPKQQQATEHASFNPFVYDLTPKAREYLFDAGVNEPAITPTGHWVHGYMTSCVASSIDITAARDNTHYIPAHEILAVKNATMRIPIDGQNLIPDQLFALNYGGSFRAFALEVDRGTEPKVSSAKRKSYAASIDLYRKLIERQFAKAHFGLNANLLVLWVFSSRSNEARFLEIVDQRAKKTAASFLTQSIDGFHGSFRPPPVLVDLYSEPWNRASNAPVSIGRA